MEGYTPPQENLQKPEDIETPQFTPPVEAPEEMLAKEERQKSDAIHLEEVRASLGLSPIEEKSPEPVVEELLEVPSKIPVEEKIEQPKLEKDIVVDESLKRKLLDFTESLDLMNGRLSKIDKETEVVSPGTVGKFRSATRSLESSFQGGKLDLNEATNSFNRLTSSFQDMSLIQDRDLRKITEDARKSLVSAIEGSKDSAMALRMNESVAELRKNINKMIDKADEAAHRFRRGAR